MFDLNRLYNADCMEAMKEIPDGFFQLAICDPPYGIKHDGQRKRVHNNVKHNRKLHARKGWVVWDKGQHGLSMSDCELAYSSFDCPTRVVVINRAELQRDGDTIHPTQKPVRLYEWILQNYAHPGDRILDTHAGSASSLIACYRQGFEFVGFEIDRDYYAKASERLAAEMAQIRFSDYSEQTGIEKEELS